MGNMCGLPIKSRPNYGQGQVLGGAPAAPGAPLDGPGYGAAPAAFMQYPAPAGSVPELRDDRVDARTAAAIAAEVSPSSPLELVDRWPEDPMGAERNCLGV